MNLSIIRKRIKYSYKKISFNDGQNKTFLCLSPNYRTGGPEAIHQLAHILNENKYKAYIYYYDDVIKKELDDKSSLIVRNDSIMESYNHYALEPLNPIDSYNPVFLVPEVELQMAIKLKELGYQVAIYWLSVNNSFRSLSEVNASKLRNMIHLSQSKYVDEFLGLMGFEYYKTRDYIFLKENRNNDADMSNTILVSKKRQVYDLDIILDALESVFEDYNNIVIDNLSREELFTLYNKSKYYVDFGSFPGLDRMPREAAMFGVFPILLNTGAYQKRLNDTILSEYAINSIDEIKPDMYVNLSHELINDNKQRYSQHVSEILRFAEDVAK